MRLPPSMALSVFAEDQVALFHLYPLLCAVALRPAQTRRRRRMNQTAFNSFKPGVASAVIAVHLAVPVLFV